MKSWLGKSKDSTKRVLSGVGLARLLLFCPGELLITAFEPSLLLNGVVSKLEVLNLWHYILGCQHGVRIDKDSYKVVHLPCYFDFVHYFR